MKKIFTLFTAIILSLAGYATTPVLSESFDRSIGQLSSGSTSDMGTNKTNWYTAVLSTKNYLQVVNTPLTYSGYQTSANGKAVQYSGNGYSDMRALSSVVNLNSPGKKIYLAFLMNVSTLKSSIDYFMALNKSAVNDATAGNQFMRVYVQKVDDTSFKLGVAKGTESSSASYMNYSDAIATNTTHLIIVEYEKIDGDNNDSVRLYINSTKTVPGKHYLTTYHKLSPTDVEQGSKKVADASSFYNVTLRPSANTPTMVIDEIRVTTAWDDLWEEEAPSTKPDAPSNLDASDVTYNAATISWDAVAGADSYDIRYKVDGGSYCSPINIASGESYDMTGLLDNTSYYVQVRTNDNDMDTQFSDWSAAINFTTDPAPIHTHNDITFDKWDNTTAIPTSGTYYLYQDVALYNNVDLVGDLTLCLNGHNLYTSTYRIKVPDGVTLIIYDNEGGGRIYGYYVANYPDYGLISVNGGTLIISEGSVENLYDNEYGEGSYAICNNGTLKLSGSPTISGVTAGILLFGSNVVTIESGKPLTNTTPYVVQKGTGATTGVITSGWANMGSADPADFLAANSANKGVVLEDGEAKIAITSISLNDNSNNASLIAGQNGKKLNVTTNRSFTAGMYNTICLPFALSSSQIESVFGAGTDVQELNSSSYNGEYIDMYFSPVSAMAANTPYLINPANDVANAAFNGVTIVDATPATVSTSYVDLIGITSITALTASEDRYLLGANNKLGYLEANGNLKGMRAYFDTHNLGGGAAPAKRLRIAPDQSMPSALDETTSDKQVRKHMENGQLIIIRDGKRYNALGAEL